VHAVDRAILEHCLADFRALKPLKAHASSGALYRHVGRLVGLGWLEKRGSLYRTTIAGHRQLAEAQAGRSWAALERLYPPLAQVPTSVHRALIEVILAAVVARQNETRADRHPFFVAFGATFHWKTSLGRFLCYALGLDPAIHVVEFGSETGKSLSFRRGADGSVTSRRALLEAPLVVLDDVLKADPSVRSTLNIFLAGRLTVPVENEQVVVRPVPLLTLNPAAKPTLEGRVGLSAPLIRRGLFANLDAVTMPDLASIGEPVIEAARAHPPLVLRAPQIDGQVFRDKIVELTRAILLPEAHNRIDVEILINLSTGMSAFIAEPLEAIAQVIQRMGLLAETLGWTRPGWIESVADELKTTSSVPAVTTSLRSVPAAPGPLPQNSGRISIALDTPPQPRHRTNVPDLDLSTDLRGRLIWFAVDSQIPLEDGLCTLLDFYLEWRESTGTLGTMAAILSLAERLGIVEIDVETLHDYLEARDHLAEHACDFTDVPEAIQIIEMLCMLPFNWDWEQAGQAMDAIGVVLKDGIDLKEVEGFLEQHRRLKALGFSAPQAVAVAEALERVGATGDRRDEVLNRLIDLAGREVNQAALEEKQSRLETHVVRLEATVVDLANRAQHLRDEVATLEIELSALKTTRANIQAECDQQVGALAVARALHAFLLSKTKEAEALWSQLEQLLRWRQIGGRIDDWVGQFRTEEIRSQMFSFLRQLITELSRSRRAAPGAGG
jgi:hypothetical protein